MEHAGQQGSIDKQQPTGTATEREAGAAETPAAEWGQREATGEAIARGGKSRRSKKPTVPGPSERKPEPDHPADSQDRPSTGRTAPLQPGETIPHTDSVKASVGPHFRSSERGPK
jgi:hypothetical protein